MSPDGTTTAARYQWRVTYQLTGSTLPAAGCQFTASLGVGWHCQ